MVASQGLRTIDTDMGFSSIAINAKQARLGGDGQSLNVVTLGTNPGSGTMLSIASYAFNDLNAPDQKAYSSTITWNAWKERAGMKLASIFGPPMTCLTECSGDMAGNLKYHMRHQISNVASNNIMSLAHAKYPQNVDQVPLNFHTLENGGPVAGHGRW